MIVGLGTDIVEIDRIEGSVQRFGSRFLERVFCPAELLYCLRKKNSGESLAVRFAAKEAAAKALGTGISQGVGWLDIEVAREESGRPFLRLSGRAAALAERLMVQRTSLSLTHSRRFAIAVVAMERV